MKPTFTHEQIRAILEASKYIDGGCSQCISHFLSYLIQNSDPSTVEIINVMGKTIKWDYDAKWEDVCPQRMWK